MSRRRNSIIATLAGMAVAGAAGYIFCKKDGSQKVRDLARTLMPEGLDDEDEPLFTGDEEAEECCEEKEEESCCEEKAEECCCEEQVAEADLDGDGEADAVVIDEDGDGEADVILVDTDGDGCPDAAVEVKKEEE